MLGERHRDGGRRIGLPLHSHGERSSPLSSTQALNGERWSGLRIRLWMLS